MSRKGKYGCHYCHFRHNDLKLVKYHEEKDHGYFRDAEWRKNYKYTMEHPNKDIEERMNSVSYTKEGYPVDIYHILKDGEIRTFTDATRFGNEVELVTNRLGDYDVKHLKELKKEYKRKDE